MKKYIIGVDIGGTKIAAGLITTSGKLKTKIFVPTLAKDGFEKSLEQVYYSIEKVISLAKISRKDIKGIGVCAPGPLDPVKGIVHNPPNLQGWKEVPLRFLIEKRFKIKTKLENDANAAGMAELIWGAARGYKHVFYVTVSTGIGTAVIIDSKIYHGKNGMAGEGGHVTINYDQKDSLCACGNIGCIESLASGDYTVKRLMKRLEQHAPNVETSHRDVSLSANETLSSKLMSLVNGGLNKITMVEIGKAAKQGDKLALAVIDEQAKLLGIWAGSMISLLDPEIIVIGGGVSSLGELLLSRIRKTIPFHTINIFARKTPVVRAKLRKDVGIFGAASVFMKKTIDGYGKSCVLSRG
ncbi:MAG: ROK family protein [Candidatus Omnitrophota bacterium]